jgi:hypothetical protein
MLLGCGSTPTAQIGGKAARSAGPNMVLSFGKKIRKCHLHPTGDLAFISIGKEKTTLEFAK